MLHPGSRLVEADALRLSEIVVAMYEDVAGTPSFPVDDAPAE